MTRLALGMLRRHRGAYLGTFVASVLAVALLAGAGLLLYSVLTARPPADRFAAAAVVVVSGDREVTLRSVRKKKDKVTIKVKSERLTGADTLSSPSSICRRRTTHTAGYAPCWPTSTGDDPGQGIRACNTPSITRVSSTC